MDIDLLDIDWSGFHKYGIKNLKRMKSRSDEHIGDAVVLLAARLLVHEYFEDFTMEERNDLVGRIVSNTNLAKTYISGKIFEEKIGRMFFEEGSEFSIEHTKRLLQATEVYIAIVKRAEDYQI